MAPKKRTPKEAGNQVGDVLEKILKATRAKPTGRPNSWIGYCPAHKDTNPSLSITVTGNRILLHCFAGCRTEAILAALGLTWKDLFLEETEKPHQSSAGLTLAELAIAKKLPLDFLRSLGLSGFAQDKKTIVRIPYLDENGKEVAVRLRLQLTGDNRFRWRKGDTPTLYGLWRLAEIRQAGYVLLVEGESDCWTAWFYNLPTLGIPGKTSWRSSWASYLSDLAVYFWLEPDALDLVERVSKDIRDLRIIEAPPGSKDLSDLHVKGEDVPAILDSLLKQAQAASSFLAKGTQGKAAPISTMTAPFTDLGNAERLVARHGQDLRYCHPWKRWLVWDGRRWCFDDTAAVVRRAKETTRAMYAEAAQLESDSERRELVKFALHSEHKSRLSAMIELAASEKGIPILPTELDHDPWLLNVFNGTLDLRTGELNPHRREDLITKLAPVEYDPFARCPRWLQFLDEIMAGNKNLVAFLQRAVGMSLTGDVSEQVLFIPYGTGRNGKSTFLRTIQALLGEDYAAQAPPDLLLARRGERHPTELADLYGKRFVACIETAEGCRLAENIVKWLTGGDRIKARRMREDFWEFLPTHKIWLATNHKPQVRGTDLAIWSRLKLIPFTVSFPEEKQDKRLLEKLMTELPGILRWAVEGCLAWQHEGLGVPEEVKAATEEYRSEQDILAAFLADCCVKNPSAKATAKALYQAYMQWCGENGEQPMTQRSFGTRLAERGFTKTRLGSGYVWHGLGLRVSERSEP